MKEEKERLSVRIKRKRRRTREKIKRKIIEYFGGRISDSNLFSQTRKTKRYIVLCP